MSCVRSPSPLPLEPFWAARAKWWSISAALPLLPGMAPKVTGRDHLNGVFRHLQNLALCSGDATRWRWPQASVPQDVWQHHWRQAQLTLHSFLPATKMVYILFSNRAAELARKKRSTIFFGLPPSDWLCCSTWKQNGIMKTSWDGKKRKRISPWF